MTDTKMAPTDAELMQVIKDVAKNSAINRDGSTSLRIARAVLAKWGAQPVAAPVGMEPVYQIGQPFLFDPENTWRDASKDAYDVHMPNRRRIIYTAAQVQAMLDVRNSDNKAAPSGPAREPLTDEQIDQAIAELGLNYIADGHATNRAVLRKLCRHANGITAAQKGGQHGTD